MDSVDMMYSSPIPLLFQSGYLTIKDFDKEFKSYRLGFSNEEVNRGSPSLSAPTTAPFAADPRKLFKVGVRFGSESKGIDEWKVVE